MTRNFRRAVLPTPYLMATILWAAFRFAPATVPAAEIDFAHDIAPILKQHCAKCHAGDKQQGGFSLNTREGLLAGGESGKAAIPGKSNASPLLERLTSTDPDSRMPPEGPRVPPGQLAKLKAWIDAGIPWDAGVTLLKSGYEPPLKPRRPALPPGDGQPLDRLITQYWSTRGIPAPPLADDANFARRASLDLVGLLPEPERVDQLVRDTAPNKREAYLAELLADDIAYAEHWLTFWNDLLRNDYSGTGFITGGRKQITTWLYRALAENRPFDQVVRELIRPTAESDGFILGIRWRGDVSASQSNEIQFSQSVSQALLGINMKCASCHDSFVDHWKLDDAYGLAAIFATQPLAVHRCDKPTGATAQARWIFPELGNVDPQAPQPERLRQLAALLTHPDNGRVPRTIVNRLWQRLMGRGIVHPVDAMDTEPWSADVLDYLAADFQDHGYDLRRTLRVIASSRAYQAKIEAVDGDRAQRLRDFHGPVARRLTAEQFVDTVWQLTGAAPLRPDAAVVRARSKPDDPSASNSPPLAARWIWSSADASSGAAAGQTVVFRRKFTLDAPPASAVLTITCDNEYSAFMNGHAVGADASWESVESLPIESRLQAGANELLIVATNGGAGPNPAGLIAELRLQPATGATQAIGTDATWEWTATKPNARGKFPQPPTDWKPAALLANPAVWEGAVGAALRDSTNRPLSRRMVRASLMKNDFLMRSLGRPHREQIVTMRPAELTTLEAIDLANSEILADYLQRGGERWVAKHPNEPQVLIDSLYRSALGRSPTSDEQSLAASLLGPQPTVESTADLLWCLVMLPEFQFVR